METNEIASATVATPIGRLSVVASPRGLLRIAFPERASGSAALRNSVRAYERTSGPGQQARRQLAAALRQLREYFAGRRDAFDLPLDLAGTAHQQRVWQALQRIPFGRTLSYGQLAAQLGAPRGARAVGRACATNPVPVVVPCHRVVGGDGELHGYDGGLWRKQRLLELERAKSPRKALPHSRG
jgi:O-6-methylguanine DNA methyltransferase